MQATIPAISVAGANSPLRRRIWAVPAGMAGVPPDRCGGSEVLFLTSRKSLAEKLPRAAANFGFGSQDQVRLES